MRISDILGQALDLFGDTIPSETGPQYVEMDITNKAELIPTQANNDDHSEGETFVPPLQLKIELLKKSVGVDNIYDDTATELDHIKKNAGINVVAVDDAGSDEPLDS